GKHRGVVVLYADAFGQHRYDLFSECVDRPGLTAMGVVGPTRPGPALCEVRAPAPFRGHWLTGAERGWVRGASVRRARAGLSDGGRLGGDGWGALISVAAAEAS